MKSLSWGLNPGPLHFQYPPYAISPEAIRNCHSALRGSSLRPTWSKETSGFLLLPM